MNSFSKQKKDESKLATKGFKKMNRKALKKVKGSGGAPCCPKFVCTITCGGENCCP